VDNLQETVEAIFRRESGRIIAGLIRCSRSFDLAEEAMQDAFASAVSNWREHGLPENPAAWINAAASRKLIDYIRREQTRRKNQGQLAYEKPSQTSPEFESAMDAGHVDGDDRLRLIFTCCHPALNVDAQVALTLRTLGGLSAAEIARAYLIPETTLMQRLVRAKRRIQEERIPYEVPSAEAMPERLASVRSVLYLIFNEGYSASGGDALIRRELCSEAISLARTLNEITPCIPENMGLLALMLLHDSRRKARCDETGRLIVLDEQDRSLWDESEIEEGTMLVRRALGRRTVGPYQLQAAIAAVHAEARSAPETDWTQIVGLYSVLRTMQPTPVVALNHAVAVAMAYSPERGLAMIEETGNSGELDGYHLYHAARADLLRRMGRGEEARAAYRRALELTANEVERRFLQNRLAEI
jgi:RNA polymerase sigma-70 factor (ECF subfamily)